MGTAQSVWIQIIFITTATIIPLFVLCYKVFNQKQGLSPYECKKYSAYIFIASFICAMFNDGYIGIIKPTAQEFSNNKIMESIINNQHLLASAITEDSADVKLEKFKIFITKDEQEQIDRLDLFLNIARMFISFFGFSLSAILLGIGLTKPPQEMQPIVQHVATERLILLEKKTDRLLKVLYCILGMMILFAVFYLFDRYF